MHVSYVTYYRLVKLIARHLDGLGCNNSAKGNYRNVRGAASDIHHHIARGLGDIHARTDSGRNRLGDKHRAGIARTGCGIVYRLFLYLRDVTGDANEYSGLYYLRADSLAQKVLQHLYGKAVLADNSILQGLNDVNISGGASKYLLRVLAKANYFSRILTNRNDRRLLNGYALATDGDKNVRRSEIDSYISAHSTSTI